MENRTARINMKVRPSWMAAAETRAEELGYSLSRYIEMVVKKEMEDHMRTGEEKRFVFEENREKWGNGDVKIFPRNTTEEKATKMVMDEWNRLVRADQQSYLNDALGVFRLFEIEITPEEAEMWEDGEDIGGALTEFETREIWSAV